MNALEVEFMLACEELAAARDVARPDPARIERLQDRVRAAQHALWFEGWLRERVRVAERAMWDEEDE